MMNSKEAIKNIKETMIIGRHGNINVGNKYNREILIIEKDLEVLEIIKRKLIIATNFVSFIAYDNDEEYNKIMEWIINEINKNKSVNSES